MSAENPGPAGPRFPDRRPILKRNLTWILAGLILACAHSRREAPPDAVPVDALLPSGRHLLIFDFVQGRYQRWNRMDACRLGDTLRGDWAEGLHWLTLAAPGTPFAPIRAAAGPNGHFYLLDRIDRRLALYDTNAQFLSSFPLPPELKDRNPDHLQVYWTRDGIFSFLDLSEGFAWQFTETRTAAEQGDWRLINRIRLPLNLESCLWEPFFRNPCCRVRSGATQCFDRYFNPNDSLSPGRDTTWNPDVPGGMTATRIRVLPEAGGPGWTLVVDPACSDGKPPVSGCFHTDKGLFHRCIEAPGAAGPGGP